MTETYKLLVLSTGHIPRDLLDELNASGKGDPSGKRPLPFCGGEYAEYGWFFHADPDPDPDTPQAIREIMAYARSTGHGYVLLDCDADTVDGLTVYDHG